MRKKDLINKWKAIKEAKENELGDSDLETQSEAYSEALDQISTIALFIRDLEEMSYNSENRIIIPYKDDEELNNMMDQPIGLYVDIEKLIDMEVSEDDCRKNVY